MIILNALKDAAHFNDSEQIICDYILKHPKKTTQLTVDAFAQSVYCAPSSVTRFCQKLGFRGFSEFKIKLASELNSFVVQDQRIEVNIPIKETSSDHDIMDALLNVNYQTLTDTYQSLDVEALAKVADLIVASDIVSLWGQGPSLLLLEDFHYLLKRIGVVTILEPLIGFSSPRKRKKRVKEIGFIVSNFANTERVSHWIDTLVSCDIETVLLTANATSPLIHKVHHAIIIENNEALINKVGTFSSRISMAYVLDIIYAMVFSRDYKDNMAYIENEAQRAQNCKHQ